MPEPATVHIGFYTDTGHAYTTTFIGYWTYIRNELAVRGSQGQATGRHAVFFVFVFLFF